MRKLFITILMFISGYTFVNAQDELVAGELSIKIINNPQSKLVTISLVLISPLCWDANLEDVDEHNLTDLFTGTSLSPATSGWREFYICWESDPLYYDSTFALGLYKVYATIEEQEGPSGYFTIDYRTSDLPESIGPGCQIDLAVDFNVAAGKFYYPNTQTEFPTNNTFWDLRTCVDDIKTELEPLPPTDLVQTASTGHPVLEWQHASVTPNWRTGYKIYRSLTNPYNFTVIGTVSYNTNTFTDEGVLLSGGGRAYYKLTAINGTRESVFSNTIEVDVNYAEKIKGQEEPNSVLEYRLSQNFPNPFNPLTTIAFSLKENSFVTLKVFDILGRKAAILVNNVFEAGNHQVEFDGSNFESGIYFYEISANSFRDVKKLILLK